MRRYGSPARTRPLLVLAHGAGAGADHPWMRHVAQGLEGRGIAVITFDFPYMEAGRRAPDRGPVLEAAVGAVWREAAAAARAASAAMLAGGKSMGGRISSQVAAGGGLDPAPVGLVCFGYPLHPPRKPQIRRDRHLAAIACPTLFVQGTRDPFGSPDEMRALVAGLRQSTLQLVDGGDHSLATPRRHDPGQQAIERALDAAASWIRRAAGLG